MKILEQLERLKRLDQLIRLKMTGTPKELARRLKISKSTIYNLINVMKCQGANIYYCATCQSFCYAGETYFYFGFFSQKLNVEAVQY